MTRHYVTVCHASQLPVLACSMLRHCQPFVLHVLNWDNDLDFGRRMWEPGEFEIHPETRLRAWPRDAFLARHPGLLPLPGRPRNANETACTVRWTFALDVMADTGCPVTVIDGDMWFWSSPEPVFEEIGSAGCAVSPHRFAPAALGLPGITLESHRKYSLYNGGWVYLADREPAEFMARTAWEWCYLGWREWPDGRLTFGDQGQLEMLAERGAHVIRHIGLNVAPWNVHQYKLVQRSGLLLVDAWPVVDCRELVTYHFSSLRLAPDGTVIQFSNPCYDVERAPGALEMLYGPYLRALRGGGQ